MNKLFQHFAPVGKSDLAAFIVLAIFLVALAIWSLLGGGCTPAMQQKAGDFAVCVAARCGPEVLKCATAQAEVMRMQAESRPCKPKTR